jgi:hypothetical protein
MYDIAVSAAPQCIAVEQIAAFWNDKSRSGPDATIASWLFIKPTEN